MGIIEDRFEDAVCNIAGLINVEIIDNKDMNLQIGGSKGSIINLGMVNLSSPSTGIIIKPSAEGSIFVTHDIDDTCKTSLVMSLAHILINIFRLKST
ncbi:MAG: hypothetical protein ACI86M_002227 [Saprospiraceae bacterium]